MRNVPIAILLFVTLASVGGCSPKSGNLKDMVKKLKSGNLKGMMKKLQGPSGTKMVAMMFDQDNADRRREGVVELSSKSWGLEEPYLKGYAVLLRSDSDSRVRSVAATALGRAGDVKYLPDVVAALSDSAEEVRWDAAIALDNLIGDSAIEPLKVHAMNDVSRDVRACATKALRHYRRKDVARTLVACLGDDTLDVRYHARASLTEITGRDLGYQTQAWSKAVEEPYGPPTRSSRAWWDWFGVRGRSAAGGRAPQAMEEIPQAADAGAGGG